MNTYYPIRYFGDLSNMMRDYVMNHARKTLERANAEKAALRSVEQVKERQRRIRSAFVEILGGLPPRPAVLNPQWGPLRERGEYSVQNVMFIAATDVYVTATIWRPVGWSEPRPGVLFPCGHDEHPREEGYQEVCARFAVNGYVTLAFDPPGQGEQKLCWDTALEASFAGSGSAEHQHCGLKCELVGHNIARYFVQYGRAAFDLMASMPEVDSTRIAVTGSSGGGTQSSYLMMTEERLAAGMPCTFTTDRWTYMQHPHWHDEEQNLTGSLLAGIDYDDFYFCFAPKPAAIGAVTWDFFPIEGTRIAYERARHAYELFGVPDRLRLFEVECGHSYHLVLQRNAIEFFNKFLQPDTQFRDLRDYQPEPIDLQLNTSTGQVSTSIPEAKLVFEQVQDAVLESKLKRHIPSRDELSSALGLPTEKCPFNPRILHTQEEEGLIIEKSFIRTESDVKIPMLRLSKPNPDAVLLFCGDGGVEGIDNQEEKLLRQIAHYGMAVYLVEPRGLGETATPASETTTLRDLWIPQHLRMLGTSQGALQAYDLLRVIEYIRSRSDERPIHVMGCGRVSWSIVLAAALDGKLASLCLEAFQPSIEQFATERTVKLMQAYVFPGILQLADLPELVKAALVQRVLVLNPVDCFIRSIPEAQWQEDYAPSWSNVAQQVFVKCNFDSLQRHQTIVQFLFQYPQESQV